jgi:type I restriction enzyme M protein
MATSSQQKQELFKAIWATAEDLRNSVDGWDFKSYVLGILFYRFISENITNYINRLQAEAGFPDFDYATFSDAEAEAAREQMVHEKGFFILPSQLFRNVRQNAKNDANLNITLAEIFKSIEASAIGTESEDDLKGLFADIDVNSNKLGGTVDKRNEQLTKILNNIGNIDLKGEYHENQIDIFGDAYEYLMTMYASNAGKSGGEFFTPQEVSELLARIVSHGRDAVNKVYDPACGSGSLLLQFAKVLGKENVKKGFFGQELNITTYNLCRINMFLHDINYSDFDIRNGDTLIEPYHWDDEPFDAIVSNPPYSTKWVGDENVTLINDPRFAPAGVLAPKSKSDLAFTMHMLSWLSTEGTAAIVEFPGVLYRGGAEMKIRKYLIDNNYVDTVIQLPANLFFGVTIATCIIVLKKSKRENKTLFINAADQFVHEGNKNKLSPENIAAIVDEFANRAEVKHFSAVVDNEAIAENGYNLSVSSYVEAEDTRPKTDIRELNARITEIVERENRLRAEIDTIIAELEGGAA